jgi:uncharacterized membrane protein YkoI
MRVSFAVALSGMLLTGAVLLPSGAAADTETKVTMRDLPMAVQQAVKEQSKGATLRSVSKEIEGGKTEYEAELTVNGHGKDISFDPAGKVVGVEEEVPLASLPEPARTAIQNAVGRTGKLRKLESVKEDGNSFYEAHIRKAGKSSEIQVDANGRRLK